MNTPFQRCGLTPCISSGANELTALAPPMSLPL